MPTQRFLNLNPAKRERITQAVIDEFAENGVDGATVSGIVSRAGIPRGSFYQYFRDLEDAWDVVAAVIAQENAGFLAEAIPLAGEIPFIDFWHLLYVKGVEFAMARPKLWAIGSSVFRSRGAIAENAIAQARNGTVALYSELIEKDKQKGIIRADVDSTLLSLWLFSLSLEVIQNHLYGGDVSLDEVKVTLKALVDMLKHGIYTERGGDGV